MPGGVKMKFKQDNEIINDTRWMVFWRIIFEVQKVQKGGGEEAIEPVIRQEIALWDGLPSNPNCVGKEIIQLVPVVVGDVTFEYNEELKKYVAIFNGGYIKCENRGLREAVNEISNGNRNLDEQRVTINYEGENIGIRAHLKLRPELDLTNSPQNVYPLFFYDQQPGFIGFSEVTVDGEHHIDWKVCDLTYQGYDRDPRRYVGLNDWHSIQVRQDGDVDGQEYYYEYSVDGLPLNKRSIPWERTSINIPPGEFYIGYMPAFAIDIEQNGDPEDPFKYDGNHFYSLYGEISQLVFDPNDTCWTC
jgi:hypothetical protein